MPPKKKPLEPIHTYLDIMYGQVVTVRVFPNQGKSKPKPYRPHSGSFTADDRKQEYALTGTKFPDAAPATVKRFTHKRWNDVDAADFRQPPKWIEAKEQLVGLGAFDWDCFREPTDGESDLAAKLDAERTIVGPAIQQYGKPVILAALQWISVEEAALALGKRKLDVCQLVKAARVTLWRLTQELNHAEIKEPK